MMCDVSESRLTHLKSLYPEVEGETNYNHMLNGAGLDAVVIATSVKTHFPMAKASLLSGKHTFIEKPMAASSQECEELIDIAKKKASLPVRPKASYANGAATPYSFTKAPLVGVVHASHGDDAWVRKETKLNL